MVGNSPEQFGNGHLPSGCDIPAMINQFVMGSHPEAILEQIDEEEASSAEPILRKSFFDQVQQRIDALEPSSKPSDKFELRELKDLRAELMQGMKFND